MTDLSSLAARNAANGVRQFDVDSVLKILGRGEIILGLGVIGLVCLLILPLPSFLLDLLLAFSITSSVLILMTGLMMQKPLEFSAFPTVLLLTTLLRLGLNIASTRLILAHGHEGTQAAGGVIHAFGNFIMQGNFAIGAIVFIILVLVNFLVITKGASRIAEVSARFTLDAMPGKQLAVDSDLGSGLITEDQAKARRKELELESTFFGSMDGASKFVRGDAIASLIITVINIVAGLAIGTLQHGLPLQEALNNYTILTIGDGLVSQIPALVISVAAGILVTKAGVEGAADKAVVKQLASRPEGLGLAAAVAGFVAVLPGMPTIPFALIALAGGYLAYRADQSKTRKEKADAKAAEPPPPAPAAEEPIATSLAVDELKIELGFGLLALINDVSGRKLTDQIKALRRQLAQDMGFVAPSVRIVDNLELASDTYCIKVKEMEAGRGRLKMHHLLAMDPGNGAAALPGERVKEPAFGLPAIWIDDNLREEANLRGFTVVDPATVLTTHFTEVVKDSMPELLSYGELKKLIKEQSKEIQTLVEEISPSQISFSSIQRVLQNLLKERLSIRDLAAILDGIAEIAPSTGDLVAITEHVRSKLARQLCLANGAADGALVVITLSPAWEASFHEALVGDGANRQLALAPSKLHQFVGEVRNAFDRAAQSGDSPVLLTSPAIRPYVRSLIERFRSQTIVMSQAEIHPKARLRAAGQV